MTKNQGTIALLLALAGAQVPALLNSPQPSNANICSDVGGAINRAWNGESSWRPGALNQWAEERGDEARRNMGGEDTRPYWQREQSAQPAPSPAAAPYTTPMPPTLAPVPATVAEAQGMSETQWKQSPLPVPSAALPKSYGTPSTAYQGVPAAPPPMKDLSQMSTAELQAEADAVSAEVDNGTYRSNDELRPSSGGMVGL